MERWRKAWTEKDPRTDNWSVRWRERGTDGKLHKKSLLAADYQDAIARRDIKNKELKESFGSTVNPHAETAPLLEQYITDRTTVRELRPGAIAIKRQALTPYVAFTQKIQHVSRDSLIAYRDQLYTKLAPATVGIRFREVKAFVRWLWHEGKLEKNVFVKIEMPRQKFIPHMMTDDEILAIENVTSGEFKALYRMTYLTGMRRGEIMAADWRDFSMTSGRAFLTVQSATAKNRRSRTIPLRKEIVELIGTQGEGPIFPYHAKYGIRWAFKKALNMAGIKHRIRFHDLRHAFCRLYLQGGGTIADLMTITGHQSLSMMQVYAHFETRWKSERMDAMTLPAILTGHTQGTEPLLSVIQGNLRKLQVTMNRVEGRKNALRIKHESESVTPSRELRESA